VALTNHFELSDQNMTVDNYDHWLEYLNRTSPGEVASVDLRHCDLQTFLDQVLWRRFSSIKLRQSPLLDSMGKNTLTKYADSIACTHHC